MHRIFEYLFPKGYPELDWIQLEITSYCNGSCIYCPHSAYKDTWQDRSLSLEAFRDLVPAFEKTRHVHLQGWGEPFTHPDFFKMLTIAKKAGYAVGTTTNSSLLTPESIETLVGEGLDIIAFSLAGVDERNDSIRLGTSLRQVLQAIEDIQHIKTSLHTHTPKIHIAYMLLRSSLADLGRLPAFLGNLGIDQAVISSLSLIVRPELEEESFFSLEKEEYSELRQRLGELKKESERLGVDVHFHLASPLRENVICSENIERALVIGSDGSVSPCVMANIPAEGKNFHYLNGIQTPLRHMKYGNILEESLDDIWHRKAYKQFRKSFLEDRKEEICKECLKLRIDDLSADTIEMR